MCAAANELLTSVYVRLIDPEDVIVTRGQPVTLTCGIQEHQNQELHVRWQYNDVTIPLNDSRWRVLNNGSLYIPKVPGKRANSLEGEYRCHVKTGFGALLSSPATLRIASK